MGNEKLIKKRTSKNRKIKMLLTILISVVIITIGLFQYNRINKLKITELKATDERLNPDNLQLEDIKNGLNFGRHHLTYKNVSTTVSDAMMPDITLFNHLAYQGADNTLCVQLSVTGDTDAKPKMLPDIRINEALQNATTAGVRTTQLKLHIGLNFSDSYARKNYNPSSSTFFPNWKAICLHYAQICVNNNIPVLCIGCEQVKQSVDTNYSYWQDIVKTIKAQYPSLLLTYAAHAEEQCIPARKFWNLFDFIGFNMYFHYTNKLVSQNPTVGELIQSFYNTPAGATRSTVDIINYYAKTFNKKIFITETGLMPRDSGLSKFYDSVAYKKESTTYNGSALAIKAICDGLCQNENIIGFSWWHSKPPFDYFNNSKVTVAEKIMRIYLKGGLI